MKFVPAKAFAMEPIQLHMLLSLVVADSEEALSKAKMPALKALLVAYAKDGERAQVTGKKPKLVERVAAAVRRAGTAGFARVPVFDQSDTAEDGVGAGVGETAGEAAGDTAAEEEL